MEISVLAGELARAAGHLAVVCVGCPVAGGVAATIPLVLLRPPFGALPLPVREVLLAVELAGAEGAEAAERCREAAVREVWLLELSGNRFERFVWSAPGRYRRSLVRSGESVTLAALPQVSLTPLPYRRPSP